MKRRVLYFLITIVSTILAFVTYSFLISLYTYYLSEEYHLRASLLLLLDPSYQNQLGLLFFCLGPKYIFSGLLTGAIIVSLMYFILKKTDYCMFYKLAGSCFLLILCIQVIGSKIWLLFHMQNIKARFDDWGLDNTELFIQAMSIHNHYNISLYLSLALISIYIFVRKHRKSVLLTKKT